MIVNNSIGKLFLAGLLLANLTASGWSADPSTDVVYPPNGPVEPQKVGGSSNALGRVFGVAGSGGDISYFVVDLYSHTPTNAAVRSAILPGWGQIYNGRPMKGTLIMGSMIASTALTFSLINKANQSYDDYTNAGLKDSSKFNDYEHARTQAFVMGTVSVGIWIYSMVNAYRNAHESMWSAQPSPVEVYAQSDGAKVIWKQRF